MFCLQSPFTLLKAENSLICSSSTASSSPAFLFAHRAVCYQAQRASLSRTQFPKQKHVLAAGMHQYIPLGPSLTTPCARLPILAFLYRAPPQLRIAMFFSCASTTGNLRWHTCYNALAYLYYDILHTQVHIISTISMKRSSQLPSSVITVRWQSFTERPGTN